MLRRAEKKCFDLLRDTVVIAITLMKAVNSAVLREIYTETLLTRRHRFCEAHRTSFLKAINMVMNGGDKLQALKPEKEIFCAGV